MLPELQVYQQLNNSTELLKVMDEIRGKSANYPLVFMNNIPETLSFYTNAPMIRITFVQDRIQSADNDDLLTTSTVEVDFWTRKLADSAALTPLIRRLLRDAGWYQFDNARKLDPDSSENTKTQLYMNTIWVKSYPQ